MNVFISWSKERSRLAALALRDWLPSVLQSIRPWMSKHDLGAGARWGQELDEQLETTNFGIICITPENAAEPWLNYEAGALAKRVSASRIIPYLVGMTGPSELPEGPLSRFQAKIATTETFDVVSALNADLETAGLSEILLQRAYEKWWPDLDAALKRIPSQPAEHVERPDVGDMVREILGTVREMARKSAPANAEVEPSFVRRKLFDLLNRDHQLKSRGISVERITTKGDEWVIYLLTPAGLLPIPITVPDSLTGANAISRHLATEIADAHDEAKEVIRAGQDAPS